MEFHISCHHTPDNCAVHRSEPPITKSWAEHCKEVGVTFIKGGVNAPQHNHFIRSEERRVGKECRAPWSPYH